MPTTSINLVDDYAWSRIDYRVHRLTKSYRLSQHDAQDLRQELAAELVRAAARFDASRSSPHTFVNRVLDMHCLYLGRRLRLVRSPNRASVGSLDAERDPIVNDSHRGELTEQDLADVAMDLQEALDALPRKLRVICEELKHYPPTEVARRLRMHRGSLYRAITRIRAHLQARGVEPIT